MSRFTLLSGCGLLLLAVLPSCARASEPVGEGNGAAKRLLAEAGVRRLRAGFVVVDGVYNTELTAPLDVFEHTRAHVPEGLGIEVVTISRSGGAVKTAEGLVIQPDHGFSDAPPLDILVLPSAAGSRDRDLDDVELIGFVETAGESASLVMSLCWGAFVLAEAGLLDDVAMTTFPADYDTFSLRFPHHDLRINVSFVHDGKALTSAGGARSFEAALHVVDLLYGDAAAAGIAGGLLVPWPPEPSSGLAHRFTNAARLALGSTP